MPNKSLATSRVTQTPGYDRALTPRSRTSDSDLGLSRLGSRARTNLDSAARHTDTEVSLLLMNGSPVSQLMNGSPVSGVQPVSGEHSDHCQAHCSISAFLLAVLPLFSKQLRSRALPSNFAIEL